MNINEIPKGIRLYKLTRVNKAPLLDCILVFSLLARKVHIALSCRSDRYFLLLFALLDRTTAAANKKNFEFIVVNLKIL